MGSYEETAKTTSGFIIDIEAALLCGREAYGCGMINKALKSSQNSECLYEVW